MLATEVVNAFRRLPHAAAEAVACSLSQSSVAGTTTPNDPANLATNGPIDGCLPTATEVDAFRRGADGCSRRSARRLPAPVEPQGAHMTVTDDCLSSPKGTQAVPVVEEVASRTTPLVVGGYAFRVEPNDTSHGVRLPFDGITRTIVALAYLTSTIRSQGFSPSQRFNPARASWFCFTPLPPIGFGLAFRAFPTQPAVSPLGDPCSLAVGQPPHAVASDRRPLLLRTPPTAPSPLHSSPRSPHTHQRVLHIIQ
jgi:hypothetical protein